MGGGWGRGESAGNTSCQFVLGVSVFFICLVRQLHREFLRAGADVIQAFTFSMDDDLEGDQAKYGVNTCLCLYTS